jgi:LacI family transcriptional regulator
MNSRTVTLDQVARLAGVSPSTVSRILNGSAVVSADKKQAVDRAIQELGYVPNPVARGLAGGRSFSIGVVTQDIDSPFFGAALRGIEDTLGPAGYSPLFVSGHWSAKQETRCIEELLSRRVDGLIVLTGRLSDGALRKWARQLPVVVTGRIVKAPGLVSLHFDNVLGAQLATAHLVGLGHRQIAFIGGNPQFPDSVEREEGFRIAMAEAGLAVDPAMMAEGGYLEEGGRQAVDRWLSSGHRLTAVFAANDQMAFGAALALHRRGLRVPQDVSLVGFDDVATSSYSIPPLTTVRQPLLDLGHAAGAAMLDLLSGRPADARLPLPYLVVRESTAGPASAV